jgi:hypothetical protein
MVGKRLKQSAVAGAHQGGGQRDHSADQYPQNDQDVLLPLGLALPAEHPIQSASVELILACHTPSDLIQI